MADNLYIVDNMSENKTVKHYLTEWCSISKQMDIATGYFEIGGLLELENNWQSMDNIRIILGSEVTKRTREIIERVVSFLLSKLDDSIENEKDKNEFLIGVPAILHALKSRKIECKVFDKDKFHAKAYITHFKDDYHQQFIPSLLIPKLNRYCVSKQKLTQKSSAIKNRLYLLYFPRKIRASISWLHL